MQDLKTTSTRIDDWLHRGPFLQELTLVTYIRHINRVTKPAKESSRRLMFFFDAHYLLANEYCQDIITNAEAVPRLVGPNCPPARTDELEEHSMHKLMLVGKHVALAMVHVRTH